MSSVRISSGVLGSLLHRCYPTVSCAGSRHVHMLELNTHEHVPNTRHVLPHQTTEHVPHSQYYDYITMKWPEYAKQIAIVSIYKNNYNSFMDEPLYAEPPRGSENCWKTSENISD